ncbi:hypothetical protein ACGVWS_10750, partial [Enterobacteriaceae bacterium LUAb1]
ACDLSRKFRRFRRATPVTKAPSWLKNILIVRFRTVGLQTPNTELKKQSVRHAVRHNEQVGLDRNREFSDIFDDIYNQFRYGNLYSDISNSSDLLHHINIVLDRYPYLLLVLHRRYSSEHMIAVSRAGGSAGIFDPNVGFITLHNNIQRNGEILNAMFKYYNVEKVDIDHLTLIPQFIGHCCGL